MTSQCMVQTVDVDGGCLAYRRWDPAQETHLNPPLIMLHGFTGSASSWADVAPALACSRTVYAFDPMRATLRPTSPTRAVAASIR